MAPHQHSDFQPPYFPPPFPPAHHQQPSAAASPAMDYLADPYSQLNSLHQTAQAAAHHYNQLTAAAGRHDVLRRSDADLHVVSTL